MQAELTLQPGNGKIEAASLDQSNWRNRTSLKMGKSSSGKLQIEEKILTLSFNLDSHSLILKKTK